MTPISKLMEIAPKFRPLLLQGDIQAIGTSVSDWSNSGLTVRVIRGCKTRDLSSTFNEFAAALQFPLYFGENKDAFEECLSDLDTLPSGRGYVIVVTNPEEVLADEEDNEFRWLIAALDSASETWALPIEMGESWDRPGVPFHVVFAGNKQSLDSSSQRLRSEGWTPQYVACGLLKEVFDSAPRAETS